MPCYLCYPPLYTTLIGLLRCLCSSHAGAREHGDLCHGSVPVCSTGPGVQQRKAAQVGAEILQSAMVNPYMRGQQLKTRLFFLSFPFLSLPITRS